jgi:hypothetical protein
MAKRLNSTHPRSTSLAYSVENSSSAGPHHSLGDTYRLRFKRFGTSTPVLAKVTITSP